MIDSKLNRNNQQLNFNSSETIQYDHHHRRSSNEPLSRSYNPIWKGGPKSIVQKILQLNKQGDS